MPVTASASASAAASAAAAMHKQVAVVLYDTCQVVIYNRDMERMRNVASWVDGWWMVDGGWAMDHGLDRYGPLTIDDSRPYCISGRDIVTYDKDDGGGGDRYVSQTDCLVWTLSCIIAESVRRSNHWEPSAKNMAPPVARRCSGQKGELQHKVGFGLQLHIPRRRQHGRLMFNGDQGLDDTTLHPDILPPTLCIHYTLTPYNPPYNPTPFPGLMAQKDADNRRIGSRMADCRLPYLVWGTG
ncbi:hypothetical protein F5X96DRAFT_692798 [Biscogniauxia mediterranea]|nr:hypothetical protein F5X96DRAFT_692798 [Biscogniauxia mediterranea]